MRITADKRQKLLDQNEGYSTTSYYSSRNFSESRRYEISGGELHVHSKSNTSWADNSRTEEKWVADSAATNRYLHENLDQLDTTGIE